MATLAELRKQLGRYGLVGYSRAKKAELESLLKPIEVFRGDLKVTRKLGRAFLRQCGVATWETRGSGRFQFSQPCSWWVPQGVIKSYGLVPIAEEQALEKRAALSKSASAAYERRMDAACESTGALYGSRTAHSVAMGRIDIDHAELIAFKTRYRHEHTNYDALISETRDKELSRDCASEQSPPESWSEYRRKYGFWCEVSEAITRVLQEPKKCHPIWFCEAVIAVRRAGLNLSGLSYETIRAAIADWRIARSEAS